MLTLCAWCGDTIVDGAAAGPASHGICGACVGTLLDLEVTDIYALGAAEADRLPFGRIELAADGTVRAYNRAEAEMAGLDPGAVLGRNFFTEVAPCTGDTEVERTFRELVRRGGGGAELSFVFRFRGGHRIVRLRVLVAPARDRHLLLVQDLTRGAPEPSPCPTRTPV